MPMKTASLHDSQTISRLIEYIASRKLGEGHRLPSIKELAGEWQLAPHVVRDALLQAQTMGLVRVRPRSGSYVRAVNFGPLVEVFARSLPRALTEADRNLFDLLEARRLIEVELAGLAAGRRRLADLVPLRDAIERMYARPADYERYLTHNEAFHLGVAKIGGNEVFLALLRCLLTLLRPVLGGRQPATWKNKGSEKRRRDAAEHEAIFQALLAGDTMAVKAAMLAHLQDTTESLLPRPEAVNAISGG